jgi:hypothetical protein
VENKAGICEVKKKNSLFKSLYFFRQFPGHQISMDKGTTGDFVSDCPVMIADELTSSTGETGLKPDSEETGHERLLRKTASTEGRSIPHCRASRPPHYLCFAIIVSLAFCELSL